MAGRHFVHPLIFVSSRHSEYGSFTDILLPYIEHWGMAFDLIDSAEQSDLPDLSQWPLIILAHPGCLEGSESASQVIRQAVGSGVGLVSLGEEIVPWAMRIPSAGHSALLSIKQAEHPIASTHLTGERRRHFNLSKVISPFVEAEGEIVASIGRGALLALPANGDTGSGKVAVWTTLSWARPDVLGPLYGIDGLLWRSFVWAARKPFVLRCLPPFATMRVDDVSGFGKRLGGESGLYWLRDCNELGWKPWIGLFLDDLTPDVVDELRPMLATRQVTACPHAFSYWDFIYFLHKPKKPELGYWSEASVCEQLPAEAVEANARRVEAWFEANPDLPMSSVVAPHYYELSEGFLPYLRKWGFRYILSMNPPNRPYGGTMTYGGPFYKNKLPFASNTPVYYADWYPTGKAEAGEADWKLFASVTEIRDDNGYEWAPNESVDESIRHGINQLSRAFDSLALAQLFTHESGYIQYIAPERWRAIMEGVTSYARESGAILTTLDDAMAYLADMKQSCLKGGELTEDGRLRLRLSGASEGSTKVAVFADDSLLPQWSDIEPFRGDTTVTIE